MYGPTDLKKNTLITIDGQPYKVIEYSQKVMGRGGSIVNVKIKNMIDGSVLPKTFKGQEKIEPADVTNRTVQYLYNDGESFVFMDPTSFDQFEVPAEVVGDAKDFMKDGNEMDLQFFGEKVINVMLPKNVELKVTYTENAVKGNTSTSAEKDATLETGLKIRVPLFIKVDDVVSVDTESAKFRKRI